MGTKELKLYEIFSGDSLKIAEKIQQRRLQMLVHSYIYYELNDNLISDDKWSAWATELADLQNKYPDITSFVSYRDGFDNWDGSTGAFLPYKTDEIINIANRLLRKNSGVVKKPEVKNIKKVRKKLF